MKKTLLAILALSSVSAASVAQSKYKNDLVNPLPSNVIRISPIKMVDYGMGIGLNFEYERLLKDKNIGIVLPVAILFRTNNDIVGSNNQAEETYYYFNPGLKFYPGGVRKVSYAIGPSLIFGHGTGTNTFTTWNSQGQQITTIDNFVNNRFGMMVNNYVEFQVTPRITFSVEAGLGARYYNKYVYNNRASTNNRFSVNGNFGVSFGYRF